MRHITIVNAFGVSMSEAKYTRCRRCRKKEQTTFVEQCVECKFWFCFNCHAGVTEMCRECDSKYCHDDSIAKCELCGRQHWSEEVVECPLCSEPYCEACRDPTFPCGCLGDGSYEEVEN